MLIYQYVKTRCYDSTIGRFISPDSYEYLDPETIGGLNLYAYCLNNPVMYTDPSGHSVILTSLIIGAIVGAVTGAFYGGVTAYANGSNIAAGIISGMLGGGIMGAGAGIASAFIAPVLIGANTLVGLTTTSSLIIGGTIAFGSGMLGGVVSECSSQINTYGRVRDLNKIVISAFEYGIINTLGAFLGSFAYTSSGITGLTEMSINNYVVNNITGVAGLIVDIFK